jgi:DNA polymerase-1
MIALVDADSLLYKIGFTFQEKTDWGEGEGVSVTADIQSAKVAIDGQIEAIRFATGCDEVELWLTGGDNFRHTIVDDYKANRTADKPILHTGLWQHLVDNYDTKVAMGYEADDKVVYLKKHYPDDYFLCAIDKDILYQCVGTHFNYNKGETVTTTPKEALRFFFFQCLVGDPTDNYKGVTGIGKVGANKLLDIAEDTKQPLWKSYYTTTIETIMERMKMSERKAKAYFLTQARLASMHQLRKKMGGVDIKLFTTKDLPKFGLV